MSDDIKQNAYPFGFSLDEMDTDAFFNMREWLTKAVEAAGAKRYAGGIGMGQADIAVEMDGANYEITIRPLPLYKPSNVVAFNAQEAAYAPPDPSLPTSSPPIKPEQQE